VGPRCQTPPAQHRNFRPAASTAIGEEGKGEGAKRAPRPLLRHCCWILLELAGAPQCRSSSARRRRGRGPARRRRMSPRQGRHASSSYSTPGGLRFPPSATPSPPSAEDGDVPPGRRSAPAPSWRHMR
jgi:hypothetical protein